MVPLLLLRLSWWFRLFWGFLGSRLHVMVICACVFDRRCCKLCSLVHLMMSCFVSARASRTNPSILLAACYLLLVFMQEEGRGVVCLLRSLIESTVFAAPPTKAAPNAATNSKCSQAKKSTTHPMDQVYTVISISLKYVCKL